MKLAPLGIALVAVAAVGCFPATEPITRGIAIGTTGGTATDVLVFTVQPSNVTAGNVMTPAASVTLTIGTNPVGGNLSGTTAVAPVNGVARFGDLSIDRSGTGYTLRATASGATAATSTTFDVLAATGSAPVR
ncbi:MAG: hypothetical protein AUH78_05690 [Gemmatimonadetes bacterium 13_1_40CM_4_69_8]|nr:MAG: hypothetical protein AUH78_05690 [Gemmatimonadetes bacterium 13_1_40CM_4_69_8]